MKYKYANNKIKISKSTHVTEYNFIYLYIEIVEKKNENKKIRI